MTAPQLARLYQSGHVRRYHDDPVMVRTEQSNADHQGRCVQLLLALHPNPSPALVRHMAFHDAGEMGVGDLSGPFKRAHPDVAAAHAKVEDAARQAIVGGDCYLTPQEAAWASLIDRIEAICWCITMAPEEFCRPASGWAEMRADVEMDAEILGRGGSVRALFADLLAGVW